jgi:YidC/Oxa1 family membrane protein insertase
MKSEYRGLIAIVLSVAVFVVWYAFIEPPRKAETQKDVTSAQSEKPLQEVKEEEAAAEMKEARPAPAAAEEDADPQAKTPVETTLVETSLIKAEFSNDGAVPVSWVLKNYRQQKNGEKKEDVPVNLVSADGGSKQAMALHFLGANFAVPEKPRYKLAAVSEDSVIYRWESNEVVLTKRISLLPGSYLSEVNVEIENKTDKILTEKPLLEWSGVSVPQKSSGFFGFLKQPPTSNKSPIYYLNGKTEREHNVAKIPASQEFTGTLYWAGLEDRYFLAAVIPRNQSSQTSAEVGAEEMEGVKGARRVWSGAALASTSIPPGEKVIHKFSVYAGPKEINELKAAGVRLEEAIDYGWFTVIAIPILYALKFFYKVVRNYGVAIIILTVFIKLILHPINKKSMKSMKQMQALQPKLKELQTKFKEDRNRLNVETMQLFRTHKVNPMSGCLPMLLQFPIYIALYKVLWNSIELYRAPFFWFYKDLSAPDPYLITPILLGIGMLLQQKLTPSASADPAQKKMMMMMPLMFCVFMLFLPVGLVIYILVNTAMSVVQQWMYNNDIRFRDLIRGRLRPAAIKIK